MGQLASHALHCREHDTRVRVGKDRHLNLRSATTSGCHRGRLPKASAQSVAQLVGGVLSPDAGPLAFYRDHADSGGTDEPSETNQLPPTHAPTVRR